MFDGRIYRAAFVALLFVLVIAGFSLASKPGPLHSGLAPDAFDGARAFAQLQSLSARFPDRRPGSASDDRLAAYIATTLGGLGGLPASPSSSTQGASSQQGAAGGGFQIFRHEVRAQTIDGMRTLTTVVAERPGSTGLSPIAIVARRDAVGHGGAAELSGTAMLLELGRVFAQSETRRTIVLVSTSGGSGGYLDAADSALREAKPVDAAIVLGDVAGTHVQKPFVLPFSSVPSVAPESLQRTLDSAISQEVGADPGALGDGAQLAHLAFPLTTTEAAPLNAAGVPSVLLQVSGERSPTSTEEVSQARLLNFGRAVLSATYALDEGPDIQRSSSPRVSLGRKLLPAWAIRLVVLALLLGPLLVTIDALARLRRRSEPLKKWVLWTLTGSLPFFTAALFAVLLGALGIVDAPSGQLSPGALSADGSAPTALASTVLVFVLTLLSWPALVRRFGLPPRPSADGAALAVMLVLLGVALLAWIANPFACLLLLPAVHLWLLAIEAHRSAIPRARGLAFVAIVGSALPLGALLFVYARDLGLGPVGLAESAVLVLAGGQVGLFGALLWSVALGCLLAVLALASRRSTPPSGVGMQEWPEFATRGPASYAGPGSLGGTESALHR